MKLSKDEILYLNALEKISGVHARFCVVLNGSPHFLVDKDQLGKVIGKKGETIRKIRGRLGRKVEVFEYADSAEEFAKNAFPGAVIREAKVLNGAGSKTLQLGVDAENKSKILNNNQRLRSMRGIADKCYGISSVRVR